MSDTFIRQLADVAHETKQISLTVDLAACAAARHLIQEGLSQGERENAACASVQSPRQSKMDLAAFAAARHLIQEGLKEGKRENAAYSSIQSPRQSKMDLAAFAAARHLIQEGFERNTA